MKRRQFIKGTAIVGGTIVLAGGGVFLSVDATDKSKLTIASALNKLDYLAGKKLVHKGEWDLYKMFTHCAQSVEYSMTGFPEHKSSVFKNTVGKLAFSLFSSKGKMTHDLSDPIPGAPLIVSPLLADTNSALNRFKQALIDFEHYNGILAPHFAYGELTKSEYEIAHVMHLNNHLQEVEIITS